MNYKKRLPGNKGFISGTCHSKTKRGHLIAISVKVAFRGQGLGQELVLGFEEWVRKKNGTYIAGEALEGSLPFWKKLGYSISKENDRGFYPIKKKL